MLNSKDLNAENRIKTGTPRPELRILIYEPDLPRARGWSREFLKEGYDLTFASSIGQAETLARQKHFDLALLDVDLPHQSSRRLLHFLKQSAPDTTVCMVTDYGDEELWIDLVNEGASDLLCRPVQCRDVEKCLAHRLRG
jgi:phosphoserine phosphatase RsbU/P